MPEKTICVIGLGYIGLPTAALLASQGYRVLGVDINPHVVSTINDGRIHIVEPDLDAFVRAGVTSGKLTAHAAPQPADVYLICVPTPFHPGSGIPQPNLDHVYAATRQIAPLIKDGDLVILESTSPVGTTDGMVAAIEEAGISTATIHVAYCPERVLPGKVMTELVENDRIVGGQTPESARVVANFYRTFVRGEVLETDARTAEMCKLTENSFRDTNIAFANELSMLCDLEGIDVWNLIALANRHPRVNILQPGAGVGGHCIAVDPWFIVARQPEAAKMIRTAREVNTAKTEWVVQRIAAAADRAKERLGRAPRIACMGLAFKPDIDDLRESPALAITRKLANAGHDILAVEPHVEAIDGLRHSSIDEALGDADLFAFLVRHRDFLTPEFSERINGRDILDFCGVAGR